jgi:uncharacterized protein
MAYFAVADTAFVFAVLDTNDQHHKQALTYYNILRHDALLPSVALTEIAYHVNKVGGSKLVADALTIIRKGPLTITDLMPEDYDRAAEILHQYHDSRIDFVDAGIMALAERLNIARVLTYDHRDFALYRPSHIDAFTLLP